jgi:hypothetical protein
VNTRAQIDDKLALMHTHDHSAKPDEIVMHRQTINGEPD